MLKAVITDFPATGARNSGRDQTNAEDEKHVGARILMVNTADREGTDQLYSYSA
jgi:hypothetical protein